MAWNPTDPLAGFSEFFESNGIRHDLTFEDKGKVALIEATVHFHRSGRRKCTISVERGTILISVGICKLQSKRSKAMYPTLKFLTEGRVVCEDDGMLRWSTYFLPTLFQGGDAIQTCFEEIDGEIEAVRHTLNRCVAPSKTVPPPATFVDVLGHG